MTAMGTTHEENLSTEQPEAQAQPRIQGPYGYQGGATGAEKPSGQGARATHALAPAALMSASAPFGRRQRLTRPGEFGRVFARSVRSTDAYFTVLARRSTCDNPRLGLAISKRVARTACTRNRLRRLSRETFRCLDLPAWDFVVMARGGAPKAENKVLRGSLMRHFKRIARRAKASSNG